MGYWIGDAASDPATQVANLKKAGYAGVMVFEFENEKSPELLGKFVDALCGPGNWKKC